MRRQSKTSIHIVKSFLAFALILMPCLGQAADRLECTASRDGKAYSLTFEGLDKLPVLSLDKLKPVLADYVTREESGMLGGSVEVRWKMFGGQQNETVRQATGYIVNGNIVLKYYPADNRMFGFEYQKNKVFKISAYKVDDKGEINLFKAQVIKGTCAPY